VRAVVPGRGGGLADRGARERREHVRRDRVADGLRHIAAGVARERRLRLGRGGLAIAQALGLRDANIGNDAGTTRLAVPAPVSSKDGSEVWWIASLSETDAAPIVVDFAGLHQRGPSETNEEARTDVECARSWTPAGR
jgi:hypothetical protein